MVAVGLLLAVQLGASLLTNLSPHFLIFKLRVIPVPTS